MRKTLLAIVMAAIAGVAAPTASAKTLKWASQGDILTMDPHAQNESLNNAFNGYVYEALVDYDKTFKVVPSLAVKWSQVEPTRWRFELRPNVKFHDGTPFTADDVVFSVERALQPTSNFTAYTSGIKEAKKVNDLTVDIITSAPAPLLLRQLTEVRMMSKAWCQAHKVTRPQDFKNKEETYAARNTNGTGPYILKSREADVKSVFAENTHWWGKRDGNVTDVIYTPIKADATRLAALLSGEIDLVLDPAPQDIPKLKQAPNLKIVEGQENRTIFFGMDQHRDELQYSNVKGKNPFKDLRVRQALYHAIDAEAIKAKIMRSLAVPTGSMVAPQVDGYVAENDKRLAYDPAKAKELLKQAGYPDGFEVTMDCPNDRYINDEEICQAAAAMWAKIGMKVKLNVMPKANYFPKLDKLDTSMFLLGWGVPTFDAQYSLQSLIRTRTQGADGNFNRGRYSNAKVDELIDGAKSEIDLAKRRSMLQQALKLSQDDVSHIPLHHQVIPWVMKQNVKVVHRADNRLDLRWIQID